MEFKTMENPLSKYFRQPQLYMKLPSEGKWYDAGALDMPVTKELAVYAMTARDELTLKTPDALLNGQATVDVIQSCVPAIKNAWKLPSVDLDAILIAIRQATYGNHMEFVSICPHCQSKNEHAVDLSVLAERITCPNYDNTVTVDDLEIYFRPHNFEEFNKASLENFEQQRLLAVINDKSLDDEVKIVKFRQMFDKLLNLTVEQITKSVAAIKTVDGVVVEDRAMIDEFFKNCNRNVWEAAKGYLETLSDQSSLRKIEVTCDQEECKKPYTTPLVFETSSFFV